jgi:hypothetical protein
MRHSAEIFANLLGVALRTPTNSTSTLSAEDSGGRTATAHLYNSSQIIKRVHRSYSARPCLLDGTPRRLSFQRNRFLHNDQISSDLNGSMTVGPSQAIPQARDAEANTWKLIKSRGRLRCLESKLCDAGPDNVTDHLDSSAAVFVEQPQPARGTIPLRFDKRTLVPKSRDRIYESENGRSVGRRRRDSIRPRDQYSRQLHQWPRIFVRVREGDELQGQTAKRATVASAAPDW